MKHNSGQTLIEVIIAVGLIVMVLTTLASGVAISVRNNRVAKDQAAAKESVREGLEWLRSIRDQAGWETFAAITKESTTQWYCLDSLPATKELFNAKSMTGSTCPVIPNTTFSRKMTTKKNLTGGKVTSVAATVTVSWKDGDRDLSSNSTITLYQWK